MERPTQEEPSQFELILLDDCNQNPISLSAMIWEARRVLLGSDWEDLHWRMLDDGQQVPVLPPVDEDELRHLTLGTLRSLLERGWISAVDPVGAVPSSGSIDAILRRTEAEWAAAADHTRVAAGQLHYRTNAAGDRALASLVQAGRYESLYRDVFGTG